MFSLNESNKFMVYGSPVDLRKGVEPLSGLVRLMHQSPTDGRVYVFLNRSRSLMKLLHWERKVLEYIATLYELEANLKYANADHDEIRRQRQEKAVPILAFIRLMLEKYRTVDTPASALAKACDCALERWDGLCRYCDEGYYEIDNNAVERSIRPITLGRKNWLFVDSDESAKDAALYMTLIGSCNLLGIAPYKYFEYILPRLHGNMTKEEYEGLLPYKVCGEDKPRLNRLSNKSL